MSDDTQRIVIVGRKVRPDDVTLVIDGRALGGWESVRITRGIERCPSDFELQMTERYPDEVDALLVKPGDTCRCASAPTW
jgi:prophage tail gpP-like protein